MRACVVCGVENKPDARFCNGCGAGLASASDVPRQRKTVTVVFCDIIGSTALGEANDPEATDALLSRYSDRMHAIITRHGGTVEKFIGDAIVGVFGVPIANEDDALRCLRAALEMRSSVVDLGIGVRLGVDSGEVITSPLGSIVTGDAANVAARLQQVAAPGEILVGGDTILLARDAVSVEELAPLELKGKARPVTAFRLLDVAEVSERAHLTPFVGRERELALLREAWSRSVESGRCEVVTIVGEPGVGKSRLAAELVARLDRAAVHGHCLPYGEGITYFPVIEVIKQLAPLPAHFEAAAPLRSLLGESEEQTSADEIAWGFRKLLEANSPLVVVFDDIHCGEGTFFDLVEHLAVAATDAPLFVICLARPELVERQPAWPVSLLLEPLDDAEVDELVPSSLAGGLRERVIRAAGGNPLYVTEMAAMAAAAGENEPLVVPATLKGLLAARLDRLPAAERAVLEAGAIEGELFHRGAVEALCRDRAAVDASLAALIVRRLISPTRSIWIADEGYRFHHLLLRDAAYEALPKATRSGLHEQFAAWIDSRGADLVEREELIGHHLEQAVLFSRELGQDEGRVEPLSERASISLAAAGRHATGRGDMAAAADLLGRAVALANDTSPDRPELLLALAHGLRERGAFDDALRALDQVDRMAQETGDRRLGARAAIDRCHLRIYTEHGVEPGALRAVADAAARELAELGDEAGLAQALHLSGSMSIASCRFRDAAETFERALEYARRSGDRALTRAIVNQLTTAAILGPGPVDEERRKLEALQASEKDDRLLAGRLTTALAYLRALAGEPDEARALARQGLTIVEDLGADVIAALLRIWTGRIELLAGDAPAAEAEFRSGLATFERLGETGVSPTLRALLAIALAEQGRYVAAAEQVQLTETLVSAGDTVTQLLLAIARAQVADGPGSERLAGEAVDLASATDALLFRGEALLVLARSTGRREPALAAYSVFSAKGSVPGMRAAEKLRLTARDAQPR